VAGSFDIPDSTPAGASSPWATLRQLIGLGRAPVDAPQVADSAPPAPAAPAAGALGLFRPAAVSGHAELFMSERTGDWIRVGCDCRLGFDHWHASH